jgi:hypothetical protein
VEKLSQLDSTEEIEIATNEHLVKFKRVATGETLASLDLG